jgi:hypothetical protein
MSPVPQTPQTPSADNRPVRGARSCTLCRQMKARCNATEQYPNPCSRCAHLGKAPCVIEPSFRRVNKRAYFLFSIKLIVQENCGDPKRTGRAQTNRQTAIRLNEFSSLIRILRFPTLVSCTKSRSKRFLLTWTQSFLKSIWTHRRLVQTIWTYRPSRWKD